MNNFYASVECMLNPKIRGLPVAVCGDSKERHGIVLAKNYLARDLGVKTGDTVYSAKQKAKDIVIVKPRFEEYIKYSKLAKEIYCRYSDLVEPYGLDECWIDVTGTEKLFGTPTEVADRIRQEIKAELGLTISVGVSFNKVFAKLGSDLKKPDAVTVISKENFKKITWGLSVSSIIGVGSSTKKVLYNNGIFTIKDLANADDEWLKYSLGKNGITLKRYANGLDDSPVLNVHDMRPIKSIGRGVTTVADLTEPDEVWRVILELSQSVGHLLKQYEKRAYGVSVSIKDTKLLTKQMQCRLSAPTQIAMAIAKAAFGLYKSNYPQDEKVRAVTVQVHSLVPQHSPYQTDIFCDVEKSKKLERLDSCIETIRNKFGRGIIKNASLLQELKMPELKPGFSVEFL